MRIYLAGPWVDRSAMPGLARSLETAGHTITERWWEKEEPANVGTVQIDDRYLQEHPELTAYFEERAIADFLGVVNADVVVVLNTSKSEGKAVEQGIAFAMMKPVILIGTPSNVFHYLPSTHKVADINAALEILK